MWRPWCEDRYGNSIVIRKSPERKLYDGMVDFKKHSMDDFYDWLVRKWFDGSGAQEALSGDLIACEGSGVGRIRSYVRKGYDIELL